MDAHSKWLDVRPMSSITSTKTIEQLRVIFSTHGLPRKVVTDNGPSFTSKEFKQFMVSFMLLLLLTILPPMVWQREQFRRSSMKFCESQGYDPGAALKILVTPHTTTGVSLAELLMGRRLRSRLDLLYPDVSRRVEKQQDRQKQTR